MHTLTIELEVTMPVRLPEEAARRVVALLRYVADGLVADAIAAASAAEKAPAPEPAWFGDAKGRPQ